MAGNALRCMAKYLYDNNIVRKDAMTIETDTGVKTVEVYTTNGKVTSATVDMGYATLDTTALHLNLPEKEIVDYPVTIGGKEYAITCVDMGNPHCVVFCPRVDGVDVEHVGPQFEHAPYFPDRDQHGVYPGGEQQHHQDAGLGAGQRRDAGLRHRCLRGGGGRRGRAVTAPRAATSRSRSGAATWWSTTPMTRSPSPAMPSWSTWARPSIKDPA